jgi:uncharacterized iron-regulated protein
MPVRRNIRPMRPPVAVFATLLLSACAAAPPVCAPAGTWVSPATLRPIQDPTTGTASPVILLGEVHDSAADHAWQLATLRRVAAARPSLVLGFEMFPRAAQPVLDRWVAGQLSEAEFLDRSDWRHVWGFPPALYLPIFRFARDHRIPMLALNVSHAMVHRVGQQGWAAIPQAEREGLADPAPPSPAYRASLAEAMSGHGGPAMGPVGLDRFVQAQLTWDAAMAQGIAAQRSRAPDRPVLALMGAGHLEGREGVPHQLAALGIADALVLIPVETACAGLPPGTADAVFVTGPPASPPS